MTRSTAATSIGRKRTREASSSPLRLASQAEVIDSVTTNAAPAPAHSVFSHFARLKRTEIASQHPQWPAQRVTRELTRQWKAMGDVERRPFTELAEFDKVRFRLEHTALAAESRSRPLTRTPLPSKRSKPGNEPRQPDTPYICFWKYERPVVVAEHPHMAAPNVSREVGQRWRSLSAKARQEWNYLAVRDRQRYEEEMAAYRQLPTNLKNDTRSAPTSPTVDALPLRPPQSGFQCFLLHNRESLALLNMTPDEFQSEMRQLWKRMGDDEQHVWVKKAADEQQQYATEMARQPRLVDENTHAKERLDRLIAAAKRMDDGPRLPQSAAVFFTAAKQRELRHEHPSMKTSDVTREVKKLWCGMNAYDRLPFIGDEQRDVQRFLRDMETVLVEEGGGQGDELAECEGVEEHSSLVTDDPPLSPPRRGRKAKAAVPKGPLTAYNMMYLAKRQELMRLYQLSQNECSALCGRMWRQMDEAERQPYYRMAAQDKERYQRESAQRLHTRRSTMSTAPPATSVASTRASRSSRTATTRVSTWEPFASAQSKLSDPDRKVRTEHPHDATCGFLYYVESKRNAREQWTMVMWLDDWHSLTAPHRQLWEELAADSRGGDADDDHESPQHQEPYKRSKRGDLDLLYGLVRDAASPLSA